MYKLSTNDKPLYVNNNETVHEIYYLNQNEICIRQTRTLSGYQYNESTKAWTQKWTQTIFQEPGTEDVYSLKRYPWLITDHLIPGKKILILKHPDGVQLYELHDKGFRLLKEDGNFHDVYSFKYIFGNFYNEQNSLGVMTSSNRGEINFYVINEESFNDDEDEPLLPLNMSPMKLSKNWHTKTTDFYAFKYKNQDVIALKMANDLEFYQLTTGPTIKQLLKTSQIKDIKNSDRIFFVNLTNEIFQDIVALTQNGLQVYQYDGNKKDYKLLDNNLRFTSENGWKSSYSKSISFMDINNDQKDDLIYTGKEGLTVITFDIKSCKWMELITPQTLTRLQRYGEIIPIINSNVVKNRSVFIKSTDGSLQWAQVISMEQIKPTTTTVAPRITTLPSIMTGTKLPVQLRKEVHEKPILRLAEYIDEDFSKQVIDIANGQVDLNIPLVDTLEFTGIPLKIQLNYNSQVISSDIVGTGWSFPIGKDYIYVDYQGSIFLEDAIFYLVIQGQTIRLDLVSSTNENILQFELSQDIDDEELSLEFNQSTQTWILNGEKYQRVYGKANTDKAKDCLRWSLSYPNWRGVGTSVNGLEPIVISWYLNAHIDKKRNRTLYYDYMIDNRFFGNYLYTGAIFLKTIRSVDNFQLILNYEKKTIDEYTVSNPKNTDGKIEFPVLLTQDRYLKNYKIQTDNYQQSITFQYQLIDRKRILTAIEQEIYTETESILKFQYENVLNTYVLTQLNLARGAIMQFNYSIFNLPGISTDRKNVLTYRTNSAENIKFSYGDDYVVMGYDNPSYIHLKILNRELTELITSLTCPGETIKDYQIHTYKNYIVVFVINENSQSLNVFTYQDERWMPDPILYRFNNNISIQFGDKLIAVSDIENNTIHLFDTRVKKWKDPTLINNFSFKALNVHKKYVIAYDDNHLWIFYNKSNQWHREKLYYLPGKLSQTYETIKRFDVNSDVKQKYIKDFTSNCFQIMKNTVVINTIKIINDQLISEIYLITINSQLKVENIQNYEFKRDHIFDLSYELPDDGSYYHLKYGKNNGKYRLQVSDFTGKIMDKFKEFYRNKNLREDAIVKQLKEFNESNDDFKNIFDKYFLINWQSLLMHTANEYIQHGDKDILQMTGIGWELKSLPQDFTIDLGQVFRIKSHDKEKKSFKLYKNGKSVKEFEIYTAGYMINRFPIYIAYQSRAHTVNVLIFKDNGKTLDREHIFYNEQLIMESNYQNLITKANTTLVETYVEPYECLIRPLATLISPKKQYYVRESILNLGELQRKTAYQQSYKFDSETSLYTQTATLIPSGNKSYAGWSEIIYSKNIRTGVQTKIRNWYNSKGIKLNEAGEEAPQRRKQKGHKKEKLSKNPMLLMDQNEQLVICDLNPYVLSDEMISYYGFESYETNTYWKFNSKNVVKNLNAFTGQNYLQINHGSRLEGTFKPRNQHIPYVASCWLRSTNLLKLNEATSILKMNLRTNQGEHIFSNFGQVKQQSNDWYYLELIIDFGVIKQVYKDYIEYYKNKALPPINNVEFEITILIESNSTIDMDHIRFSPLTHDFEAHVYNPKIGVLMATIHETGLVTRTIYNNMYRKIATIHQDGKIVELTSTSETGRLIPTPQGIQFENPYPSYLSFIPEQGSYETFTRGWETNTPNAWHVANPGQLSHLDRSKSHQLKVANKIDINSITLRFFIALQDTNDYVALILGNLGELKLIKKQNFSTMILPNDQKISFLPPSGEIIIMVEENFVSIWFDGVLIVDQYFKKALLEEILILEAQGEIMIEDFMILNRPLLEIQYMNEIGEKVQVVKFETANTALVNQIIYDALGRKAITAKSSRIHRKSNQSPLLVYRENFVTNINPNHPKSVWNTNRLYGEVHELNPMDKGVAFIRTEYWDNPLNEEKILGLPGPEYSTSGACATWVAKHSRLAFMDNLFPKKLGYSQNVQISSNGAERVTIYDMHRNKIAVYVHVPGFNHLLSTYEYNSDNQLIKILPPVYHEKVNTALKITAYQPENLTADEKKWQRILGTTIIYNENGQVLRKITPDFGPVDYIYDGNRKLRFMVTSSEVNNTLQTSQIVYFDHNNLEQLVATGYFNKTLGIEDLKKYAESVFLPNTQKFQQLDYSDYHPDPQLRGRIKHCITYNDDSETILEKIRYNSDEQIVERKTLSVINDIQMEIKKYYKNDKIQRLSYPKVNNQIFDIDFIYNRLGQLTELKTSKVSAKFTYHSTGELATESFQSNENNLTRKYIYNSPGFLEQINDPFMTEIMTYTEKGYGQAGYGDGIIMQAQFINNWSKNADARWFQITEDSLVSFKNHTKLCLSALKKNGYLDNQNKPIKLYIIELETTMPLLCGTGKIAKKLSKIIAEKYVGQTYGYQYSYGNHQELIKAKYFTDDISKLIQPLQTDSFAKFIPEISIEQSEQIWELLAEAKYILKDQSRHHSKTAIGKRGKSFFRDIDLKLDLANLDQNYILYLEPIKQFIIKNLSKQGINLNEFIDAFLKWEGVDKSSLLTFNWYKQIGEKIGIMLKNNGYFSITYLNNNFVQILNQFKKFIPKIVQILSNHFTYGLGETPFDHESYEIDANGNHQFFVSNFDRYKINYQNYSNKIDKIEISNIIHDIKHDSNGNIIKALHKGIEHIDYHSVTQRATRIQMINGLTLRFYYDAAGERILKKVFNANGKLQYEIRYVRDTDGHVLIDQRINYYEKSTEEIITYYLYGPRGLVGFIRNDTYYHILTDHAGSIRLIIRAMDNEVITAFDYLPYGKLMRAFGDISFMYRYTGHELDEETGLYNYHARLYDPSIGRFYQPDPKSQYFSPYVYAGNSPISTIDPDGEFAFLIAFIIVGAIAGAYLGGAAANNRWNPLKWDWKDPGTYFGMFFGGLSGAFLPFTLGGSVAFFGGGFLGIAITTALALSGSYIMMSVANGANFNPKKWDWSSPATLNGFFDGLGLITGLFTGIGAMHKFANKLGQIGSRLTKTKFLLLSYSSAIGLAYAHGVMSNEGKFAFWEWDWKNPNTYAALITGFDIGSGLPQNFKEIHLGFSKWRANKLSRVSSSKRQLLKTILKNPKHPLYKVAGAVVMGYFMGASVNGDFDFTQWRFDTFSTFEGILNGVFLGKSASRLFSSATSTLRKSISKFSAKRIVNRALRKNMKFMIDVIYKNKKSSKFFNLIESNFQKLDPKLLEKLPRALKQDIIDFFHAGYKKWKSGKTKIPKQLEEMLRKQVEKYIEGTSKQLKKWQKEAEDIHRQQEEVHTDRDLEFLNCRRKSAKRRKRANGGSVVCRPSSSKTIENEDENSRLFNHLLDIKDSGLPAPSTYNNPDTNSFKMIQPKSANNPNGFDPHAPKDFSEHFALILENSPFMFDVNKKDFTVQTIAGSLYSSTTILRGSIDDILMKTDIGKGHSLVKVAFKTVVGGETILVLKTFVIQLKKSNNNRSNFNDFNNIYDKDELDVVKDKLKIPDGVTHSINEHVFFIQHGHVLYGKDVSTTSDKYMYNTKFKGNQKVDFKEIKPELNANFETQIIKIRETDDINEMNVNVKAMIIDLVKMYNEYAKVFDVKPSKTSPKPGLTSFLYGAISSHLDNTFVYRIAGKGYANLIFHVPKDNWQDIPVVIERSIKKTSAFVKAMFYSLSVKSLSNKGLAVMIDTTKPSDVEIHTINLPEPKKFIREISSVVPIAENIKEILRYQYYNISNMALKTKGTANDHYHRSLILGQLLSDSSINAFFHKGVNSKFSSFAVNDAALNKWTQINLLENSKSSKTGYQFNGEGFNPPTTLPSAYSTSMLVNKIDIKLNSRSKFGWIASEKLEITHPENDKYYYFQGLETSSSNLNSFTAKIEDYTRLEHVKVEDIFKGTELKPSPAMNTLKENLKKLSNFIDSESDFQAILHGMFLNNRKEPTLTESGYMYRVYAESNPAKSGRIDLLIQKFEIDVHNKHHEKELIVMELKYTDKNDAEKMLTSAETQGTKYEANLPSFTNLDSFTLIPMVYEKKSGNILYTIKTNQNIREASLSHIVSDPDPDPGSTNPGSEPNSKRPRISRSIYDELTNSSINNPSELIGTTELVPQYLAARGTRLDFWPLTFAKKAGTAAISFLSSWTNFNEKPAENPTLLEMGDTWVQSTNTNGLLTWGIYLTNKLTGYRPKPIPQDHFDEMLNTEIQIRSTTIVDHFMDILLEIFGTSNSKSCEVFENTIVYCNAIKEVRRKLSAGDIQGIPGMLFKLLVKNNMDNFMSDELFSQMLHSNKISEFLEFIYHQEYEWLSRKQSSNQLSDFNDKHQCPKKITQHCFLSKDFPNIDDKNLLFIDQIIAN